MADRMSEKADNHRFDKREKEQDQKGNILNQLVSIITVN